MNNHRQFFKDFTRLEKALMLAAALSVGAFIVFSLNHAFYYPLLHDDAYLASVAKNLSMGYGWSSATEAHVVSRSQLNVFDPLISTGIPVLSTVAAGISIWGNDAWVARIPPFLLNIMLFSLFAIQVKKILTREQWLFFLIVTPLFFSRVNPDYWASPLGQVPCMLYFLNAAIFFFFSITGNKPGTAIFSGALLGLALLSKTAAVCALPGLIVGAILLNRTINKQRAIYACLLPGLLGVMLVLMPWYAYKLWALSQLPEAEVIIKKVVEKESFLFSGGAGAGLIIRGINGGTLIGDIFTNARWNFAGYARHMDVFLGGKAVFCIYLIALVFLAIRFISKSKPSMDVGFLALPATSYLLWAIFISDNPFHQSFYLGFFLSLLPMVIWICRSRIASLVSIAFCLLSAVFNPIPETVLSRDLYQIKTGVHPKKAALEEAVAFMQENPQLQPFAGCGWIKAFDVDYRWTGVADIQNCRQLIGNAVEIDLDKYVKLYPESSRLSRIEILSNELRFNYTPLQPARIIPVRWTGDASFSIVGNELFNFILAYEKPAWLLGFKQNCEEVFNNGYYFIWNCSPVGLRNFTDALGGLPFIVPQWSEEVAKQKLLEQQFIWESVLDK